MIDSSDGTMESSDDPTPVPLDKVHTLRSLVVFREWFLPLLVIVSLGSVGLFFLIPNDEYPNTIRFLTYINGLTMGVVFAQCAPIWRRLYH
jgi:hypothetical protein